MDHACADCGGHSGLLLAHRQNGPHNRYFSGLLVSLSDLIVSLVVLLHSHKFLVHS